MNLSNKTKKKWSLLFLFLIFFSFIFSLIRFAGADTYLLMKNADKIYYDSKGILGLSGVPFIFFFYVYIFINFIITDTNILARTKKDKKKIYDITMKYLGPVIISSILLFLAGLILSFFVTNYVHSHYTSCDGISGIYSGRYYVKGDAVCHD
ncbi:hypothetical protein FPG13_22720 [Salmonella enterica subsp. salamae]|nr:hypothetical protein [Salmonella enterica subsp. salamae]